MDTCSQDLKNWHSLACQAFHGINALKLENLEDMTFGPCDVSYKNQVSDWSRFRVSFFGTKMIIKASVSLYVCLYVCMYV
jgi:hypothetical protein